MALGAIAAIGGPVLITIAKKLVKKGSSILAEKLLKGSGPVAEKVASDIVEGVAAKYDIDAIDAGAIEDSHVGAIVDEVVAERSPDWIEFARTINGTMQAEMSAPSVLSRVWRPIFGLGFTFVYVLLGVAFAYSVFIDPSPLNALIAVSGLLMAYIAAGAAVLGVQVWSRGEEKKAGAA